MPYIQSDSAPRFEGPYLRVTGGAAPSRGAQETCAWQLTLAPGAPPVPHAVDREEIFIALAGAAQAVIEGEGERQLAPGDILIVPRGRSFSLCNRADEPFVAIAVLPVGARASLPGEEPFAPPWTV